MPLDLGTWSLDLGACWRAVPQPGAPAAHLRVCLALLPSGPDAVRRLKLHRVRAAVRPAKTSVYQQLPRDALVQLDCMIQFVNRHMLVVGVRDMYRAGAEQQWC